jgi:excisionase family DNA binding protein
MTLTLGEAARRLGVAKSTILKAIAAGRLAATREGNGVFAIDEAELARYRAACAVAGNVSPATGNDRIIEALVRAEVAEKMLVVLQAQLADMTAQRDWWRQRDERLRLPAPETVRQRPWRWFWRKAG